MAFNWAELGCTPMTCSACKKCWYNPATDYCVYGGPYHYLESGEWYDKLAEKIKKESYE